MMLDLNIVILYSTLIPMLQNVLKNNFNVILFIKIDAKQKKNLGRNIKIPHK
jgi:hypothetical protein